MDTQLFEVVKLLNNRVQPAFVILFGSYSKETHHIESDLDIAYFSDVKLSHYERFILAEELARIVNIDVDLVDLKEIDTVFAAQIYSTGKILYCNDRNIFFKERMKALSLYTTLNEQRKEVLEAIERRGTVYGK